MSEPNLEYLVSIKVSRSFLKGFLVQYYLKAVTNSVIMTQTTD